MAIAVEMPKMSDTMDEGVLVAWLAEEGQKVAAGDIIAQVETDKATMDLEVYDDGILLKCVAAEGDAIPIGGLIAVLGKEGEDISAILESGSGEAAQTAVAENGSSVDPVPATESAGAPSVGSSAVSSDAPSAGSSAVPSGAPSAGSSSVPPTTTAAPSTDPIQVSAMPSGRVKSSPLARKLAADRGIDLSTVVGTGPEGRIIKRDIEAVSGGVSLPPGAAAVAKDTPATRAPAARSIAAPQTPATARTSAADQASAAAQASAVAPRVLTTPQTDGGYEVVRISQMRKAIARRLSESKFSSPHFYLTIDLDMDRAVEARTQINSLTERTGKAKISYNDLITKASALALREHRWVNASFMEAEGEIRLHNDVHVAVAVAIDDGLITPVIRNADRKGLSEIASETRSLAERARNKQLQPEEFSGSTFTTSNLGMFGIEEFTAIINPPNACILAIGGIRDEAVVKNGEVVPGKRMKVTLSCDHRVVDGASGSRFLATLRQYLEDPLAMLL